MDSTPLPTLDAAPPRQHDSQKKGRHRHAPDQLVALIELYERDDHPSLEDRTTLGQRIGMPTKTVNAWFQNRRAALRKKAERTSRIASNPHVSLTAHPENASTISVFHDRTSLSRPSSPTFYRYGPASYSEEFDDDAYSTSDELPQYGHLHITLSTRGSPAPSSYSDDRHMWQSEDGQMHGSITRKARVRPSQQQQDELRNLYNSNPHPSKEDRERLGEKIGMRYQSITNWFQNQRSLAKKRREEGAEAAETREYAAYPPTPGHPSLPMPPRSSHPSLSAETSPIRSSHASRSRSPYSFAAAGRPRRSRPEPHQLDALKKLYGKTANPSIEERGALALEIGMDLGKVTNWFRNLRQTAKKRGLKHAGHAEDGDADAEMDDDMSVGIDFSRDGTPSIFRRGPSVPADELDVRLEDVRRQASSDDEDEQDGKPAHMDVDEDGHGTSTDDEHEALTPEASPPPPSYANTESQASDWEDPELLSPQQLRVAALEHLARMKDMEAETLKTISSMEIAGVPVEDALLLLSFRQRHNAVA